MSPRKIIHVDMDAFYASVEQRDNPALRGRPVAVGHGAKRGVVAAASYEARGFGVRSAMPPTTAMRLCAELIFVPPRFDVYRAVSRQIHTILADYTALIEPLSLDEAYLDVTDDLRKLSTASATLGLELAETEVDGGGNLVGIRHQVSVLPIADIVSTPPASSSTNCISRAVLATTLAAASVACGVLGTVIVATSTLAARVNRLRLP